MNDDLLTREVRAAFDASAEGFTPAPLDAADLWDRGRTHRRRDLLQLVAAVAVVVALAAATALVGVREAVPVDVPDGGALPREVFVPTYDDLEDITPGDDLAVGRTSLALQLENRTMLLVSALDGSHRVVTLPGLDGADQGEPNSGPRLSPDGYSLAWPTRERQGVDRAVTTIAVADLRTGTVAHTPVGEGATVPRPTQLAWSPDSSHLAWQGVTHRPLDGDGAQAWLGVVDTTGSSAALGEAGDLAGWDVPFAVTDDGRVLTVTEKTLRTWSADGENLVEAASHPLRDSPEAWRTTLVTHDGSSLLGTVWKDMGDGEDGGILVGMAQVRVPTAGDVDRSPLPVEPLRWNEALGGADQTHLTAPTPRGAALTWAVEDHGPSGENDFKVVVRRIASTSDAGKASADTELVLVHGVVGFGPGPSLAGDLGDRAPVDFDAPAWAPGQHRWLPLLVALTVAALVWLRVVVRRRRVVPVVTDGPDPDPRNAARPRRDRHLRATAALRTGVGVLLCVALTTALVVTARPLFPRSTVTAPGDGMLPKQVYALPHTVKEEAVGDVRSRVSLIEPDGFGNVVMVDARDGSHHQVEVYDWENDHSGQSEQKASLSPDGTLLVLPFARASTDPDDEFVDEDGNTGRAMVAGFVVHDLLAGTAREVAVVGPNDRPVRVDDFAWSPDGTRLAWLGKEPAWWVESGGSWKGKEHLVGVTDPRDPDGTSVTISRAQYDGALAVDDAGTGRLLVGRRMYTFDDSGQQDRVSVRVVADQVLSWSGAAVSADLSTLVTGVGGGEAGPAPGLRTVDLADPTAQVQVHPWTEPGEGESVTVLGLTPQGRLVLARVPGHDEGGSASSGYVVGTLDSVAGTTFTALTGSDRLELDVATALADNGSTEFGEPRWPISDERWFALGVLLVLLLLAVFRLASSTSRDRLMRHPSDR